MLQAAGGTDQPDAPLYHQPKSQVGHHQRPVGGAAPGQPGRNDETDVDGQLKPWDLLFVDQPAGAAQPDEPVLLGWRWCQECRTAQRDRQDQQCSDQESVR